MRKKVWYQVYIEHKDGSEELLSKVKSKGLAYKTLMLYQSIYKNETIKMK